MNTRWRVLLETDGMVVERNVDAPTVWDAVLSARDEHDAETRLLLVTSTPMEEPGHGQ